MAALAGVMAPMDRESETWGCTRWAGTGCKGTVRENHDVGFVSRKGALAVADRRKVGEVRVRVRVGRTTCCDSTKGSDAGSWD
jgi:hypothetical protein